MDGSTNPENHPYTIIAALVLLGLMDALSIPFWLYIGQPNIFNNKTPNDLLRHVYILWGTLSESSGDSLGCWCYIGVLWALGDSRSGLENLCLH